MRALRTGIAALVIVGMTTSGFAGDLEKSIAKAAQQEQAEPQKRSGSKALMAAGAGLFVGGMAVGLFAFMNNTNGEFAEFGEADAVDKKLGAAGLSAAFVGGLMVFLGHDRAKNAPSVTVGPGKVKVSKRVSW